MAGRKSIRNKDKSNRYKTNYLELRAYLPKLPV